MGLATGERQGRLGLTLTGRELPHTRMLDLKGIRDNYDCNMNISSPKPDTANKRGRMIK